MIRSALRNFIFFLLAVGTSNCYEFIPEKSTKILKTYKSSVLSNYKIEKIAILPMVRDDTTKVGTFYSTNYFLKELRKKFFSKHFEVVDIDTLIENDSLLIPNLVDWIEYKKRLDLKTFYSAELDSILNSKNYDAIIVGSINNKDTQFGVSYNVSSNSISFTYTTSCEFSYYLISMTDGLVLWKVNVFGENSWYSSSFSSYLFPPLDAAISNGIDKIIPKIPL